MHRALESACLTGQPISPALTELHDAIGKAQPEIDGIAKVA